MKINNVTREQLEEAAKNTGGVRLDNFKPLNAKETRWNVKLSPVTLEKGQPKKWASVSAISGRRKSAVNWYGFKRFFEELYRLNPDAIVHTTFGTYTGKEDFEKRHMDTRNKRLCDSPENIYYSLTVEDECDSDEEGNPL